MVGNWARTAEPIASIVTNLSEKSFARFPFPLILLLQQFCLDCGWIAVHDFAIVQLLEPAVDVFPAAGGVDVQGFISPSTIQGSLDNFFEYQRMETRSPKQSKNGGYELLHMRCIG